MSIIYHKMNSRKWIENIKSYIIDGKINVANLWCCEKNICANMVSDKDILAICYEENEEVEMLCEVIAYGKTGVQYPEVSIPWNGVKIEEMYQIKVEKNKLILGNNGELATEASVGEDVVTCFESNYMNGLNVNDTVKDFLYEINNSVIVKGGFTCNSKIGYIIVKPFLFSWEYEIRERNMIEFVDKIKNFNEQKNNHMYYNKVHVNDHGKIVLRKRAKF